jgi:alkylation response protein AidB-like acyl-CoA dehydrogenase
MELYHELGVGLSEEDIALKGQMHRFAEEVLRPSAMTLDAMTPEEAIAEGSVYWDVWREIKKMDLHKQGIPPHLGGVTLTPLQNCIVLEELGWGSIDWMVSFGAGSLPFNFAATIGHQRLIEEAVIPYLEDTEGKYIGCWPITEPAHGSDVMLAGIAGSGINFDTQARRDGDEWVITGQKAAWVTNATVATHALAMLGAQDESGGEPGFGIAFLSLDAPGITRGKPLDKIGQRALNQGEIFFDGVRIPADQMLVMPRRAPGEADLGAMGNPNAPLGMAFVGLARAAFEETLEYCKQRVQGGKPLVEHQLIQRKLFDMMSKVETARAYARSVMLYNAANPTGLGYFSNASKVYATEVALQVAGDGVQLHGGMGLSKGTLIEKLFRDARAGTIEDGANDTLALLGAPTMIAKHAY